jgi:hypothetical protein
MDGGSRQRKVLVRSDAAEVDTDGESSATPLSFSLQQYGALLLLCALDVFEKEVSPFMQTALQAYVQRLRVQDHRDKVCNPHKIRRTPPHPPVPASPPPHQPQLYRHHCRR